MVGIVRFWTATALSLLLAFTPFVLLLALLTAPAIDGLAPWWSICVVLLAYAHSLGSVAIFRRLQRVFAAVPVITPGESTSWRRPRLSQLQRQTILTDVGAVRHGAWLRFIFPTVLLSMSP